jgi:hypothetical protein
VAATTAAVHGGDDDEAGTAEAEQRGPPQHDGRHRVGSLNSEADGVLRRAAVAVGAAQSSLERRLEDVRGRLLRQRLRLAAWDKATVAVSGPEGTGSDTPAVLKASRRFRGSEKVRRERRGGKMLTWLLAFCASFGVASLRV